MPANLSLFATSPKGLELLLKDELLALGAVTAHEKLAGVEFTASLEVAYKACLWSRLANRILLKLTSFDCKTPEALYAGVQSIEWHEHLNPEDTLAVNFTSSNSQISHTLFGAQKVKDAIVDQFRQKFSVRPSVEREQPHVVINVHVQRDVATLSLDLSGESLHKRGYRTSGGAAPLKENLAAAILQRANWLEISKRGGALFDPMCGSGTLLIEGALIAANMAPGLLREYFGFLGWKQHDAALWKSLREEAEKAKNFRNMPKIFGYDQDANAVRNTFANIERAGLRGIVHVEKRELSELIVPENLSPGLVITNPPYGERLGEMEELIDLYLLLGTQLKKFIQAEGLWQAGVFSGNPDLCKEMGLRAKKYYSLFNGAIPCKLFLFDLLQENAFDKSPEAENEKRVKAAVRAVEQGDKQAVQAFVNRLQKNLKHLKKKAERENASSFRAYDADLPDYAFAIDVERDGSGKVYVTEYQAPRKIPEEKVLRRRNEVLSVLPEVLGVDPRCIYFYIKPNEPFY